MPPYNVGNYYFLSNADMQRFNVNNVFVSKDYEKTDVSKFSDHIVYLKLK